ncbi:related to NEFA-interacting nuclear protein NIP30 [Melanopsichium pennsylvanicum]|uniref:Related to NEFA-interacting nuclear protein NIP30 n=1 Tax=Melanopsichium pennsylvanicum TaxID=63383 RepID=A0AAJ4XSL2_9BASI|nr:related to NEFA-interacting nuclear protein NIP30 [Melanopsichium pennsylvanicum]
MASQRNLLSNSVSSRFVSQTELDAARSESSTSCIVDEKYDPRSLFERLQAHKQEKDAKYDEMFKLSNQFRGIDDGESEFLDTISKQKRRQELEREEREREELDAFRRASKKVKKPTPTLLEEAKLMTMTENKTGGDKVENQEQINLSMAIGKETVREIVGIKSEQGRKKKRKSNSSLLGVVKKKPPPPPPTTQTTSSSSSSSSSKLPTVPPNISKSEFLDSKLT